MTSDSVGADPGMLKRRGGRAPGVAPSTETEVDHAPLLATRMVRCLRERRHVAGGKHARAFAARLDRKIPAEIILAPPTAARASENSRALEGHQAVRPHPPQVSSASGSRMSA